jgi:hypothetical protein
VVPYLEIEKLMLLLEESQLRVLAFMARAHGIRAPTVACSQVMRNSAGLSGVYSGVFS